MSRRRLLIVVGSLVSCGAAVGLLPFGPSVIRVLEVTTWRPDEPPGDVLRQLASAATFALLFGLGTTLVWAGVWSLPRTQTISVPGRLLWALAGVASVLGAVAIMFGVLQAEDLFREIATGATVPNPAKIDEGTLEAVFPARFGFASLLVGQLMLVAAGSLGFGSGSPTAASSAGANLLGAVAVLFSLIFASIFTANWLLHGRALQPIVNEPGVIVRPSELAVHIFAITRNSRLACTCLAVQGLAQAIAGLWLPGGD